MRHLQRIVDCPLSARPINLCPGHRGPRFSARTLISHQQAAHSLTIIGMFTPRRGAPSYATLLYATIRYALDNHLYVVTHAAQHSTERSLQNVQFGPTVQVSTIQ